MKLLRLEVEGLSLFKEKIELDFFTDQRVVGENSEMLDHLFGNVYTNNVISFVGINASGKTSILKVISFAMQMIEGNPISTINAINRKNILENSERVTFTLYLYDGNNSIYKIVSIIKKDKRSSLNNSFVFDSEKIWVKKSSSVKTKKHLLEFNDNQILKMREDNMEFLKEDMSIALSISKNNRMYMFDTKELTENNQLLRGKYPKELVRFLDSSIEYIKEVEKGIEIKFFGKEKISVSDPSEFGNYLSTGTIKGLSIFVLADVILMVGGYLIVDEIENSFNKEIVASLIRFFMNQDTNPRGGTLVFSTHYSELLDELDRNDSIYIMRNRDGLAVQRLSDVLKRNDLKKSEVFQSDFLEGTAPLYDAYIDLKHAIEKEQLLED